VGDDDERVIRVRTPQGKTQFFYGNNAERLAANLQRSPDYEQQILYRVTGPHSFPSRQTEGTKKTKTVRILKEN